jgi:RNA polymerase sigma-70 factor (ECF subfamily)
MTEPQSNNDAEEFTRLLLQNHRRIMGLILALVPNGQDADDILQESSAVMWRRFGDFEPGTNFAAWALRIARFQVMSYYDREKRARARLSDESVDSLTDQLARPDWDSPARIEALRHCVGRLREREIELIRRRYYSEQNVPEIARETGATIHAVYKSLNRLHLALLRCIRTTMQREPAP